MGPQGELDADDDQEEEDGEADDEVGEPLLSSRRRTMPTPCPCPLLDVAVRGRPCAGGHGVWMLLAVLVSLATMMPTMTMAAATTRAVTTTHEAISPRSSAEMRLVRARHIGPQEAEGGPDRLEGRLKAARAMAPTFSLYVRAVVRVSDVGGCHVVPFAVGLGRIADQMWLPVKAARAG